METNIGNLFTFLKNREDRPIPLKAQFKFTPDQIDWEGLAYNESELDLIKSTDSIENVVWSKVPTDTSTIKWIIKNSPDNLNLDIVDVNSPGMISALAEAGIKIDSERLDKDLKIDKYSQLLGLYRHYDLEKLNLNEMVDFSVVSVAKWFSSIAKKDEELAKRIIDFSKFNTDNPEIEKLVSDYI